MPENSPPFIRPGAHRNGNLRDRVRNGDALVGTFVKSSDPTISEILACSGLDFLIADMEHSSLNLRDVEGIIRAAAIHHVPVIVRLSADALHLAGRVLDTGAVGIQVSDVVNRATAEHARRASSFPPGGVRSMSLSHRGAQFGRVTAGEHLVRSEQELLFIGQVESVEGVRALPGLLAEGVDVDAWFLGTLDLSVSLGRAGLIEDPAVAEVLAATADAILKAGARLGVFARDLAEAQQWIERGASLVAVGSDYSLLAGGATELAQTCRDLKANVGADATPVYGPT